MRISEKYIQWHSLDYLAWNQEEELKWRQQGGAARFWKECPDDRLERSTARLRRALDSEDRPEMWEEEPAE